MKLKTVINLLVLGVFIIVIFIGRYPGIEFLKFIPGVLLLYYLPGNNLNDVLLRKSAKQISWSTKFALDITSSIATVYIFYTAFRGVVNYSEYKSHIFMIGLNLGLFCLNFLTSLKNRQNEQFLPFKLTSENKRLVLFALVPIVLFGIRLLFNPYIYEIDAFQYYNIYRHIIDKGFDSSWLVGQRNGFALFMVYSKFIAGIDYVGFTKFLIPLLYYFTAIVLFDLIKTIKNRHLAFLTYNLIIASPILVIMSENVRPETFVIFFSLPVFYLLYLSVKQSSILLTAIALIYSYVSFRFHEFGIFLFLASLVAFILGIISRKGEAIKFVRSNLKLSFVIILPYLLLMNQFLDALRSAVSAQIFQLSYAKILDFIAGPYWKWWFLDSFTNIDDGVIRWPGLSAVLYYLYNGLNMIAALIIVLGLFYCSKRRFLANPNGEKSIFLLLLPTSVFLFVYLFIAEIFPRIGINLFPNRTWPHIMLAMIFIIIVLLAKTEERGKSIVNSKIFIALLWLGLLVGITGTMIGTVFMGGQVVPAEKGVIKKIKELPSDSIIFSTQVNHNISYIYGGNKTFIPIYKKTKFNNQAEFSKEISKIVNDYPSQVEDNILSTLKIDEDKNLVITRGTKVSVFNLEKKVIKEPEEKMVLVKKYDPILYQSIQDEIDSANEVAQRPAYFLYSYAKFSGVLARRDWWVNNNDYQNLGLMKQYSGGGVVYKDPYSILIKIK